MLYSYLFRDKWVALVWAGSILLGVYLRTPARTGDDERPAQVDHVNPWAKSAQ